MTEAEVRAHIGTRIRIRANKRGWSVERLADFAGVSRSGLWSVLAGERLPTIRWLLKVANALDCKLSVLVP